MNHKRSADGYEETVAQKRRVLHSSSQRQPKSTNHAVDQTYGQRNAFGSLEGNATTAPAGDSDLDCEDETDALAYLRSVRQQASTIPHVIVAEKAGPRPPPRPTLNPNEELEHEYDRSIYNNGTGDFRGYYHDGAYIAYPDSYNPDGGKTMREEDLEEGEEEDESSSYSDETSDGPHNSSADEIREAYFSSLIQRYLSLREIVQREPPDHAIASLPSTHPTQVEAFNTSSTAYTQWSGRLRNTDPLPAQVASMHKGSIIRLIRIILGGKYLRKGMGLQPRTSTWIWALLARLPERGELDFQEIGWIRDLGKRAVLLMIGLAEAQVLQEEYGVGGSDEDYGADMDIEENFEEDQSPSGNEPVILEPRETLLDAVIMPEKDGDGDDDDASMDLDEGEVSDDEAALPQQADTDLAAIKARLIAQLDDDQRSDTDMPVRRNSSSPIPPTVQESEEEHSNAAQVNVRATLNMILTVAGEFYGQRDLLEFRDPFGTL